MNSRTRLGLVAVAVLALIGVAAFPRIAYAAGTVSVDPATVNATEGNVGTTNVVVTFKLSEPNSTPVNVPYHTVDGTATAPSDYAAQSGTVTFAPNDTSEQVTFSIKGDQIDENNETFKVVIDAPSSGVAKGNDGTVNIQDDDNAPRVTIDDLAKAEGNSGKTDFNFILHLSKPSGRDTKVHVTTAQRRDRDPSVPPPPAPPRATSCSPTPPTPANCDYEAVDTDVIIPAGATTHSVTVKVIGDLVDEADEEFEVKLSSAAAGNLVVPADEHAVGIIKNDDAGPRIDVADPAGMVEGGPCGDPGQSACKTMIFKVTLSEPSARTVTVDYETQDRSAQSGEDYGGISGREEEDPISPPLEFAPGETEKDLEVEILGDNAGEPDERFALVLSNPVNATLGDAEASGLIIDDDAGAFPEVSVSDSPNVTEGPDVEAEFTITATWPGGTPPPNTNSVTVKYTTVDGPVDPETGAAATAPQDYTKTEGEATLQFNPATRTASTTVAVPVKNDTLDEAVEFFRLQITDAGNASVSDAEGQAQITDDDTPPKLSVADKSQAEGTAETSAPATITVTLTPASGQPVTVNYATSDDTAKAPSDYSPNSGALTFAPGETTKTFDVAVVRDNADEDDEKVNITLSNPQGATIDDGTGVLTITDDDNPPEISIGAVTVTEGSTVNPTASFPLTLSAPSGKTITVTGATSDGTANAGSDYTATNKSVTINPGQTTGEFTVPVIADSSDESDETFTVTLSNPQNATVAAAPGDKATGTITDDDTGSSGPGPKITTGAGPGGGPHIRVFQPSGQDAGVGFMDGESSAGKRVARGDLDGDNVDEIITGTGVGSLAILSVYSAGGQLKASSHAYGVGGQYYGGVFVAAGDLDNDGKDEIVTAPGAGGGPHVRTWKLNGGSLEGDNGFMAYNNWHGGAMVGTGDVNNDGKDDIITGAGAGGGPHVRVFNAANAIELVGFMAFDNFNGGVSVAGGNLDNDANDEIVVGAGPGGGPHLKLFNHDGTVLNHGIMAIPQPFTGGINVAAGDLDNAAGAEIVVSAASQATTVRGFRADLASLPGTNFSAYPGFGGGAYIAVGRT